MPKFHCIHCGQHIDAPDEHAGTQAACPSCGVIIEVPSLLTARPPAKVRPSQMTIVGKSVPLPPLRENADHIDIPKAEINYTQEKSINKRKDSKASKFVSMLGSGLVMLVAVVIGRSCGGDMGRKAAERRFAEERAHDTPLSTPLSSSTSELSYHEVAGLKLKLPGQPLSKSMSLQPEARAVFSTVEYYEVKKKPICVITISRLVHKLPRDFLDESVDGIIYNVRTQSEGTGFSSTKKSVVIDGFKGIQLLLNYRLSGISMTSCSINWNRGSEMWQIQINGASHYQSEMESLRDQIFSSVRLTD